MIVNMSGGFRSFILNVKSPPGSTVTISKDGKSKTKIAGVDGTAVFKGLSSGEWTVTSTDGTQTAQKPFTITAEYAADLRAHYATVNVAYPAGSACTATDGVTTITATDTSGTWACVVPNAGAWTFSLDNGFRETVSITTEGEAKTLNQWYLYNLGDEHTELTGGWSADGWTYGSDGTSALTPVKNTDNLQTYYTTFGCVAATANLIPLTGFSKICAEAVVDHHSLWENNIYSIILALLSEKIANDSTGSQIASVSFGEASTIKKTMSISLDGTVENAYVGCYPAGNSDCQGRFYRVWLEV